MLQKKDFDGICPILPMFKMYGVCTVPVRGLYGVCTGFVRGPRSLHFRGRRPIPRLRELAHAAPPGLRPLSATSVLFSSMTTDLSDADCMSASDAIVELVEPKELVDLRKERR